MDEWIDQWMYRLTNGHMIPPIQVHGISIFQYFQDIEFAQIWRFSQTEAVQKGIFFNILQVNFWYLLL